jgi:hypothetical protein
MEKNKTPKIIVDLKELKNSCFVIMPFKKTFVDEYNSVIQPLMKKMEIECEKADDVYDTQTIMSSIWRQIRSCRFAIAELTGKNPNVLYETGLTHALGKHVIVITRKETDVPSDLKGPRYIFYDTNKSNWGELLAIALQKTIQSIIDNDEEPLLKNISKQNYIFPEIRHNMENKDDIYSNRICGEWKGYWNMQEYRHDTVMQVYLRNGVLEACALITIHSKDNEETIVQQIFEKNNYWKDNGTEFDGVVYSFIKNDIGFSDYLLDVIRLKQMENNVLECSVFDNINKKEIECVLERK